MFLFFILAKMAQKINRNPKHELNNVQKACFLGVGLAAAPFTGGWSLVFATVHVGGASVMDAIDNHRANK